MYNFEKLKPTADDYYRCATIIKEKANVFEMSANLAGDEAARAEVSQWMETRQGQEALSAWMADIVNFLDEAMPGNGAVGHDKRHLTNDFIDGLRITETHKGNPFIELASIPSLLHDTGRLIEARFNKVLPYKVTSPDHPFFSFAIAHQFFDHPYAKEIPTVVRDHVLYAILKHSIYPATTEMGKIVQSADRAQLVGPEGVARLFSVQSGVWNVPLVELDPQRRAAKPRDVVEDGFDLLHSVEFYVRHLYPLYGDKAQAHGDALRAESVAFLYLATHDPMREQIFAPELGLAGEQKKIIPSHIWQNAMAEVCAAKQEEKSDPSLLRSFIFKAPGCGASFEAERNVQEQFDRLPQLWQISLTNAVRYIVKKRATHDADNQRFLTAQVERPSPVRIAAQWGYKNLCV